MNSRVSLLQCRYGAYLSKEEVADLVAPHPGTLELVHSWLTHHGVPSSSVSVTHGGTTLTLDGVSVVQANALLGTTYQLYRHVKTNETTVRTVSYALPAELHGLVETVAPTTFFPSPRTQWQPPRKPSGGAAAGLAKPAMREPATMLSSRDEEGDGTPSFLRWLYSTSAYIPAATDQNVLGIIGIRNEYPSPVDLAAFMSRYRSNGADATYTVEHVNGGGYDPNHPSAEANVDIQYTTAMAYPTPLVFYSTGRGPEGTSDYLISWFRFILDQPNAPQTISMSYSVFENIVPNRYATFVCNLFGILGLRGVSVLFASGDDGVGRGDCVTQYGYVQFMPRFPATCTCGVFSRLGRRRCGSLTTAPCFRRSLGHCRRRNDEPHSRGRSESLRRRLLEHL
jgi:tripeptidyl-peptidase-1